MKFILSATILALVQNQTWAKEHEFDIDYDFYESRSPVDIYRDSKLRRGG